MNVRFTPRALGEAKRIKTWWLAHRPSAADLFERELDVALEHIRATPQAGRVYDQVALEMAVRRVLLPKTKNHVYYAVEADVVVVLSVWGAQKGRGPDI